MRKRMSRWRATALKGRKVMARMVVARVTGTTARRRRTVRVAAV